MSFYVLQGKGVSGMSQKPLNCSEEECKQKRDQLMAMNMNQLSEQIKQCEQCDSGTFKTNDVATKTYQDISLLWQRGIIKRQGNFTKESFQFKA